MPLLSALRAITATLSRIARVAKAGFWIDVNLKKVGDVRNTIMPR